MPEPALQKKLDQARRLLLSRDFPKAVASYRKLAQLLPRSAVIWFEYGSAAAGLQELDLAESAWTKALELAPHNAELIGLIGHRYQAMRQPDRAMRCFQQAAASDPRGINSRISLAVLLEQNHRLVEAREAVDSCLRISPNDDQARYFSAVLDRREGLQERAEQRLRDLIASDPRHPYVRYSARYELAQILDRTGRPDEAIQALLEAKSMVRGLTDTRILEQAYEESAASAHRFTASLPRDILQRWSAEFPASEREPLPPLAFLGGHPRSGTTLLEQILGAHPEICALDESSAFIDLLPPAFHESPDLGHATLNRLRRIYLQALLREAGPSAVGKMLLDKNPSPTARLPVWLRVFPELRVIIALRDPRDVVLSCFFQNIPLNTVNVNFLSFERLARHYKDLMDIWLMVRDWSDLAGCETRYESTVADLEGEGRRVTAFLGLEWEEGQARFYEKSLRKQFYSPTYQDVTRPVYRQSVARWHAYERHLGPVLPALKPYCDIFGYA